MAGFSEEVASKADKGKREVGLLVEGRHIWSGDLYGKVNEMGYAM